MKRHIITIEKSCRISFRSYCLRPCTVVNSTNKVYVSHMVCGFKVMYEPEVLNNLEFCRIFESDLQQVCVPIEE